MTLLTLLTTGVVSLFYIPVSMLPDIEIPEITVKIEYQNANAREIESSIVKPLREALLQVNHLTDIESDARDYVGLIRLKLSYGTNVRIASIEANEIIDRTMSILPVGLSRPRVVHASASEIPVFYLSITSGKVNAENENYLADLSSFVKNVVKPRMEQLPEVAFVDVSGYKIPEIVITPKYGVIASLNVTGEDIERYLRRNNVDIGSFTVKDKHLRYHVRLGGKIETVNDLRELLINKHGKLLRLKEVADIQTVYREQTGLYTINGNEAIVLAVIKQSDAQLSALRKKLTSLIEQIKQENPDLDFFITNDRSKLLVYSVKNLQQTLLIGLILAVIIPFIFSKKIRSSVAIGFTIPVALLISVQFLYLFGLSLNIISLSGLILAVGMMIDNSIIVTDNIEQYLKNGYSPEEACAKGTNEVIRPLIASALTTMAVFVPLIFLSDIAGALFFDQAVAISVSLIVSFLVSVTILPVTFYILNKNLQNVNGSGINKLNLRIHNAYHRHLNFLLKRKYLFSSLFFLLIPLGILLGITISKGFMPELHQNAFEVRIKWNEPVNTEENRKRTAFLEKSVDLMVSTSSAFIGKQQFLLDEIKNKSPYESSILITLKQGADIQTAKRKLVRTIQHNYPEASIDFEPVKNVFNVLFSGNDNLVTARLRPPDQSMLDIDSVEQIFRTIAANSSLPFSGSVEKEPVYRITFDQEQLMLYHLDYMKVLKKIQLAFDNLNIGRINNANDYLTITLGSEHKTTPGLLKNLKVMNDDGLEISLSGLFTTEMVNDFAIIKADNTGIYFPFEIDGSRLPVHEAESRIIKTVTALPGWQVSFSGGWYTNRTMFKRLLFILLVSLVLLYLILAAQFESLIQPVIVLSEVALGIAGALLLLMIFGATLNVMSAIGIIVMSGIVINDSIIKIDAINQAANAGDSLVEAIHKGGERRLTPIIITSLTTIFALIPLLFFGGLGVALQLPLALSIIGGLSLGTVVSLYFIPLMYYLFYYRAREKTE